MLCISVRGYDKNEIYNNKRLNLACEYTHTHALLNMHIVYKYLYLLRNYIKNNKRVPLSINKQTVYKNVFDYDNNNNK